MFNAHKGGGADWINSCVDQSIVTSSWKKVESKACRILSQRLEKEMMDPVQRQILFQLLGNEFVNKYFQNYTSDPSVLENLGAKKREKKSEEMLAVVTNILDSASEGGKGGKGKKGKFPEYNAFCQEAREIVDAELKKSSKSKKNNKGKYSIEDTMKSMICYDPSMIKHYTARAQADCVCFPDKLRISFWAEYLSAKEKPKSKGYENFEKAKKKFMQLKRNDGLNDSNASSDASTLRINSTVEQVYRHAENLQSASSESAIEETSEILQLHSSYSRSFKRHHVYWAIPMQQVYSKSKSFQEGDNDDEDEEEDDDDDDNDADGGSSNNDELLATMAVLLEKTLRLCSLSTDQLFKISSKVVETVEQWDKNFVAHLKDAAAMDIPSSIKNFPSDIILQDKKKSIAAAEMLSDRSRELNDELKNTIMQPNIFIRKWIFEGFVDILTPAAILFIWDQLYLYCWDVQSIQDVCIMLLGLLKPWFTLANDFPKIREVFLEEPGRLYTLDIKKAWQHLKKKGKFRDIPRMNRNIVLSDAPKPPTPREPTPPPARIPTPPPPRIPTPPPPIPKFIPWVPYEKIKAKEMLPAKTKVNHPFDLYVDGIRIIPDNATVVKVTGKVLNMYLGRRDSIKIQAYPVLDSPYRYPQFKSKQLINQMGQPMNPDVVIMFRVYTIEEHTKKPTILGSCLFCPFSNKRGKQAALRVGGHQIRIRYGIPDPEFTVEHMLASHMDNNPFIPGATLLLRVLPYGKEYVEAPEYEKNVYRSEFARPNESEERLYTYYQQTKNFDATVRDIAMPLTKSSSASDSTLERAIQQLFDKEGSNVDEFPYERFVNYDQNMGVVILADKAAGLPIFLEGRYLQCLVQSFPGQDTIKGNGRSQVKSFLTEDLDLESSQRAPDWTDPPTKVNPEYDDRGYLLVSLFGLRPRYDPDKRKLLDKEGKEPRFDLRHSIAWSVIPLFDKGAVFAGTHIVPLIKGRPPEAIEEKLGYLPFDFICQKFKSSVKIFDSASVEITIWDGRFTYDECPPLPMHTKYLNISPNPKKYLAAKRQKFGVNDNVTQLIRTGLVKPVSLPDIMPNIVKLLKKVFKENMNKALFNADYSELIEND